MAWTVGAIRKNTDKKTSEEESGRYCTIVSAIPWYQSDTGGRRRHWADGAYAGFTGSVIDIHERKQAAQASALLSAIVDSSDDAIISKNLNGIIMSWNKSAERLFGYSAEEAIGRSVTMLIPPDRQDEEPSILARLRRGERVDHFETIRVRKDGDLINISLTISPVKDGDGRVVGASKIARDITERKLLVKEVEHRVKNTLALVQALAGLTPTELQEAIALVRRVHETGVTIVIVEHIMEVIMTLTKRVLVFNQGHVIASGTPQAVVREDQQAEDHERDRVQGVNDHGVRECGGMVDPERLQRHESRRLEHADRGG